MIGAFASSFDDIFAPMKAKIAIGRYREIITCTISSRRPDCFVGGVGCR